MSADTVPDAPVTLGERYRDEISGFEGVATARYEYLHGCVRVQLEKGGGDGKPEEFVFDEQRLVLANDAGTRPAPTARSGGPLAGPPSRDPAAR